MTAIKTECSICNGKELLVASQMLQSTDDRKCCFCDGTGETLWEEPVKVKCRICHKLTQQDYIIITSKGHHCLECDPIKMKDIPPMDIFFIN